MANTYTLPGVLLSGTHAARVAANTVAKGTVYAETDTGSMFQSDGSSWNAWGSSTLLAPSAATVATSQTTASASYTDLATSGPAVTVVVPASGKVLVTIGCELANSASGFSLMSLALSSGNTVAAPASNLYIYLTTASGGGSFSRSKVMTGLSAGSTVFTAKYKSTAGTGSFGERDILVQPIP